VYGREATLRLFIRLNTIKMYDARAVVGLAETAK